MTAILDRSIRDIAQAVRDQEITAVALAEAALARIDAVNPHINAVVNLNPELTLKYAAKADAMLAAGKPLGALHGVPMTIKDSLDTFDFVTTWGTEGRANFRPGRDATCVARHYVRRALFYWAKPIPQNSPCRSKPTTICSVEPATRSILPVLPAGVQEGPQHSSLAVPHPLISEQTLAAVYDCQHIFAALQA